MDPGGRDVEHPVGRLGVHCFKTGLERFYVPSLASHSPKHKKNVGPSRLPHWVIDHFPLSSQPGKVTQGRQEITSAWADHT